MVREAPRSALPEGRGSVSILSRAGQQSVAPSEVHGLLQSGTRVRCLKVERPCCLM